MSRNPNSPVHVVYTPESPIRHPLRFVAEIADDVRASRILAWRLAVRDITAQYRQTAFGYLWAILPPVVITLVWVVLNSSSIVTVKTGNIPYAVYALTGSIFWQLFLDALNAPLNQLTGNRSMLNRVNFPTEALLLSGMTQVLFSFVVKLLVLAATLAVFQVRIQWTVVLLVFPITGLLAIGTVAGVLLAPMGLLYKDVQQALVVLVTPLMFLTPVVYPPPSAGLVATVMRLNPLTPLFTMARHLLYGTGDAVLATFALTWGLTFVVAGVAWVIYRLALPVLIERLDA